MINNPNNDNNQGIGGRVEVMSITMCTMLAQTLFRGERIGTELSFVTVLCNPSGNASTHLSHDSTTISSISIQQHS